MSLQKKIKNQKIKAWMTGGFIVLLIALLAAKEARWFWRKLDGLLELAGLL